MAEHATDEKLFQPDDENRQARKFVFTSYADSPPEFSAAMKYLLYAPETCPTTGRKHWQGYVIYHNKKTRNSVRKELKSWAAPASGSVEDNESYIKGPYSNGDKHKPANPLCQEFGEPDTQGVSATIKQCIDDVKTKKRRVSDILEDDPIIYHTYGRMLTALEDLSDSNRERQPCHMYFVHTSELDKFDQTNCYWMDSHWACDYSHQHTLFINAETTHWSHTTLSALKRGIPVHLDRKYRSRVMITSNTIVFYSDFSIAKTWKHIEWITTINCWENRAALCDWVLRETGRD